MKVKVCGIRDPETMQILSASGVDYIGHIFYERSPRITTPDLAPALRSVVMPATDRVGVFVNSDLETILRFVDAFDLDMVQLHGTETPAFCRTVSIHRPVIKAIGVRERSDLAKATEYEGVAEFIMFDTKTPKYGGSGEQFGWDILGDYQGRTPFFLSGGIRPADIAEIIKIDHDRCHAVDLNSGFELEPGVKDVDKVVAFIQALKSNQAIS